MNQCVAITTKLKRCKNQPIHWGIFCDTHKWWWLKVLGSIVGVVVTITTIGANVATMFGATFPNPLGATTTSTLTENLTPTYVSAFLTETPTFTLAYTNTPTATWTISPIPSQTPTHAKTSTPTRTLTVTPLALDNYGGLVFDCIPDRYWDLKSVSNIQLANGCILLGGWGLHADYRKLNIILPSQDVRDSFVKDLFMPISGNVDISFSIKVKEFKGRGVTHVAPLFSVGICNQQNSDLKNNAILYSYRNDGSILWGIMNNGFDNFEKNYSYTLNTTQEFIFQIRSYDLTIMQKDGNSAKSIWSKTVPPEDLSAFCIHYTLPTLGELTVTLDNLLVEKK